MRVEAEKQTVDKDGDAFVKNPVACLPLVPLVAPDEDMFRALAAWVERTPLVRVGVLVFKTHCMLTCRRLFAGSAIGF